MRGREGSSSPGGRASVLVSRAPERVWWTEWPDGARMRWQAVNTQDPSGQGVAPEGADIRSHG